MRKSQPEAFIYKKHMKFQVKLPGNEIQFPGSYTPLDRIFHTFDLSVFLIQYTKLHFFSNVGLFGGLFLKKSVILRLENVTFVTLKSHRRLNLGHTLI